MRAPGPFSEAVSQRGCLIEYTMAGVPLMVSFEFNPQTITRSRTVKVTTGGSPSTRGGYDFTGPNEAVRASQGVTVEAETLSLDVLFDATDRMDSNSDPTVSALGVQPEIDTVRSMVEPKQQSPLGMRTLAALGHGSGRAFDRQEYASVLLFKWGVRVIPVFLTGANVTEKLYLPNLMPYRAEVSLTLQLIESKNPFYELELHRQFATAHLGSFP